MLNGIIQPIHSIENFHNPWTNKHVNKLKYLQKQMIDPYKNVPTSSYHQNWSELTLQHKVG